MKNSYLLLLFSVCLFCNAQTEYHKRVIVVGFDGLSGHGLQAANAPFMKSLALQGAYTYQSKAVFPTVSSPNWASMINGSKVRKHSVKGNGWKRKDIANRSFCGGKKGEIFPTIFKVIREQKPSSYIACVHDWDDFARLANTESMDTCINASGEFQTANIAREIILQQKPDFLFLHFDHVDHAGHAHRHMSTEYLESIAVADSLLKAVWAAVEQAGIAQETLLVISSDHGGVRNGHGGATKKELRIPLIFYGPGIKRGEIQEKAHQIDQAPTLLSYLGLQIPECWDGKTLNSVFSK